MKSKLTLFFVTLSLSACGGTVCVVHADGTETCRDADEESLEDKSCEEVATVVLEHLKEIFADCDYPSEVPETLPSVCDEALKQSLICSNGCLDLLTCGALDGQDPDATQEYSECASTCSPS